MKPSNEDLIKGLRDLLEKLEDPDLPDVMKYDIPMRIKIIMEELVSRGVELED